MPEKGGKILFIEDEERLRKNIQILLADEGYDVETVRNGYEGIQQLKRKSYDIILTDLKMPGIDGLSVLKYVKDHDPDVLVIVITGYASVESAIKAMRHGAYDYVTKPLDFDFLKLSIERALEKGRLTKELKSYYEDLEERVRERTLELRETQAQLIQSEKLAVIGELAAVVAHEIKNPLISIGGFARLLKSKISNPEKAKEIADIIADEVSRLERILKNLLNFTRESEPNLKPKQLNRLIEDTLILFDHEFEKCRVRLNLELDDKIPQLYLDADQIMQLVMNLIRNAIHAMSYGGDLTIRTGEEGRHIVAEFSDTGYGISQENLSKVFTPFFSTKSIGTGLGLAVAQKVIDEHNGYIKVCSEEGQGTKFTILFPRDQCSVDALEVTRQVTD